MEEVWKDIKGYEGKYQVSNLGRVKSFPKKTYSKERILTPIVNVDGYYVVDLCKDGNAKRYRINRLVAEAFIPNPDGLPQVGHKDETKTNNNVNNLEWTTPKENDNMPLRRQRLSAVKQGVERNDMKRGKHRMAKMVVCDNIVYGCIKDCAEAYNVSDCSISYWLNGRRKMPDKFVKLGLKYYKE